MSVAEAEIPGIERNARGELVLDIDALRPKPRWLKLPGPDGEKVDVKIPGNLMLDDMLALEALERGIRDPEKSNEEMFGILQEFTSLLQTIIDRETPGNDVKVDLDYVTATRMLIFLAQPDDSIAINFVRAISGEYEGAEKPDGAEEAARKLADKAGIEEGGDGEKPQRPLRSKKRSSSRSSRSASSTTGRRSGGSAPAAAGKRSASTSRSRSKGRGNAKQT